MTDVVETDVVEGQSVLQALTHAMVRLYKEQLGRGPVRARTAFAGPNVCVVTLERTMTPAEHALVDMGEGARMAESRLIQMRGAEAKFREALEDITGRRVRAVVCGISAEEDISTKVFYLEPEQGGSSASAA